MRQLAASALAWAAIVVASRLVSAVLTWTLGRTGSWADRVRTRRLDPLRELQRAVETALAMGLAGAIAARAGWVVWAVAAILLLWPLRIAREIRTAVAVSRNPQDTLALHERGFLADAVGPLPTRAAVVLGVAAMYVLIWPVRSGLNGVAGLAVRAAWRLLGG